MTRRNERTPRNSREKRKVEATGQSVDDAVAAASAMLKVPEDELDIEVVEEGRGGFLGIGSKKAVVRASVKGRRSRGRESGRGRNRDGENYDRGERGERGGRSGRPNRAERPAPERAERSERPERAERSERQERSRRDRNDRSGTQARGRNRDDASMAVNVVGRDDEGDSRSRRGGRGGEEGRPSRPSNGDRSHSERRDRPEQHEQRRGAGRRPNAEFDKRLEEDIREFIAGLLERMGFPCKVTASFSEGAYMIQVDAGDNDSLLIGRKGETLDALQHVAYKMASRGREESATIKIDISGYRERREGEIADEAREMAMEVKKTGESRQTEPLRAAERRLVHRAITDIDGVTTRAIGTGLVKRITIQVEGEIEERVNERSDARPDARSDESRRPRESQRTERQSTDSPKEPATSSPEPSTAGEVLDFVSSPVLSGSKPATPDAAPAAAFGRRAKPSKKRRR